MPSKTPQGPEHSLEVLSTLTFQPSRPIIRCKAASCVLRWVGGCDEGWRWQATKKHGPKQKAVNLDVQTSRRDCQNEGKGWEAELVALLLVSYGLRAR